MKKLLLGILGLALLLAGCQEPVEPVVQKVAGPKLVSCDPADGAQGLTGSQLSWMMVKHSPLPHLAVNVSVYLSGCDALVAQHFLNHAKICTILHQMRRKRMPERMRRNLFPDISKKRMLLHHLELAMYQIQ